jgi:hypothetical protein
MSTNLPNAYDLCTATADLMAAHPDRYDQNNFCGTRFCRAGFMFVAMGGDWERVMTGSSIPDAHAVWEPVAKALGYVREGEDFDREIDALFNSARSCPQNIHAGIGGVLAFRDAWENRLRATTYTPLNALPESEDQ